MNQATQLSFPIPRARSQNPGADKSGRPLPNRGFTSKRRRESISGDASLLVLLEAAVKEADLCRSRPAARVSRGAGQGRVREDVHSPIVVERRRGGCKSEFRGNRRRCEAAVVLDINEPSILIAMEFGHRST
jgi:hypothetical protein